MAGLRDCINETQVYSINFYGFSSTINVSEFFFIHECGICYALKKQPYLYMIVHAAISRWDQEKNEK